MMSVFNADKELQWYLSLSILTFFSEGSLSLSASFLDQPRAWLLMVPFSIYMKTLLESHFLLGIVAGVFVPCLAYWGFTSRDPPGWYLDVVLQFNIYFLKTGCFHFLTVLVCFLVMKLQHIHKLMISLNGSNAFSLSGYAKTMDMRTVALTVVADTKDMILLLMKLGSLLFYNGNIMLLSWAFTGNEFSSEIVRAISWVCMGSVMCKWQKSCLKATQFLLLDEEKVCTAASRSEPNMKKGYEEEGPVTDIDCDRQNQCSETKKLISTV